MNRRDTIFSLVALGGWGEIGMNSLVLECEGRLLVIDCGALFSAEGLGIDLVHPGFEYLTVRRDDIEALVLTHAHEDHIGGVPFLLREIDIPVYGTPYALGLLDGKMAESGAPHRPARHVLAADGEAAIGPFRLQSLPMPHSIIENRGLCIDMPGGRLLHTGDFKIGLKRPDRGEEALRRLREVAEGRVDLMLADSTGSEEEESAGEETEVKAALDRLVGEARGRVFVAIFASNVRRLASVLEAAARHGRQVTLAGRSVLSHFGVAASSGAITSPPGLLVPLDKAGELRPERSLVVVSGTQGEVRSALGRLAHNNHHALSVEKGDLVILSSRFIPGNEVAIGRVIDRLHRAGARVVHRRLEPDVHVSGHGSREEIRRAIEAVAPRCFLPVHGTYRHLVAAADLAREAGVRHVEVASDGDQVCCTASGLDILREHVPVRRVYVDGQGGLGENVIRDRRLLGAHGVLAVSLAVDREGRIAGPIAVVARGVVDEEALPWLADQAGEQVRETVGSLSPEERSDPVRCAEAVRSALRRQMRRRIGREPYVLVSVLPRSAG